MNPIIKWPGGKRWLISSHEFDLPKFSGRYIEPFLGSGAIFFHLRPRIAILSDINPRLIQVYQALKEDWRKVHLELQKMHKKHCKDYYYFERSRKRRSLHGKAAQFLYLNRTCFNGIYRENLKGEFNVPIGTKTQVEFEEIDLLSAHQALQGADLAVRDFEESIAESREGDLVFVDPPYSTAHNLNGFVKYNQKIFEWKDQVRLRDALFDAKTRGTKIVLTNADHDSIRSLYKGLGQYQSIERQSVIAGKSSARGSTTEAIYVSEQ